MGLVYEERYGSWVVWVWVGCIDLQVGLETGSWGGDGGGGKEEEEQESGCPPLRHPQMQQINSLQINYVDEMN